MIGDDHGKPEARSPDPDQLAKLLEIELIQKRAEWQRTVARRKSIRTASFFFLFIVIVAVLFAFFVIMPRLREHAGEQRPAAESSP
jgi:hypothetical protein